MKDWVIKQYTINYHIKENKSQLINRQYQISRKMLSMSGKDKKTLDLSAVIQIDSRHSRETKPKVSRRPTYLWEASIFQVA